MANRLKPLLSKFISPFQTALYQIIISKIILSFLMRCSTLLNQNKEEVVL
jgi:hypothetical protein